jgi:HrpA-like RNA helicase
VLVQEMMSDRQLSRYTHILVDVHELHMEEDCLLLMLRELLPARPDLRLVLMPADAADALLLQVGALGDTWNVIHVCILRLALIMAC